MTLTNFRDPQPVVAHDEAYSKLTTTGLSNPTAASNTFNGGKEAYANKNYDKAIQSFTRTINTLQRDLETALLHRAIAFGMKKKYKNAIQDTLRVNPANKSTNPDPYLIMATTLVLQDRLYEAASHLMNGFAVVPADQGQSESLDHLYQRVMSEMDRRNSWIASILPPEIMDTILSLLPIKTCIQLSLTCRYWNNYIMREWEDMWVTMDSKELFSFRRGFDHVFITEKMLKSIPANRIRFITEMSEKHSAYSCTDPVINAVIRHHWNNIEYLGVLNPRNDSFLKVLQLNRNSIKAVEIWDCVASSYSSKSNGYCKKKALMDAARICTSMRSISIYHNRCQSVPINTHLQSSNNLVLTRLKLLYSSCDFETPDDYYVNYTRTLSLINTQCPMLQELIIDTLKAGNDDSTLTYSPASFDSKLVSLSMTIPGTSYSPCTVPFNEQVLVLAQKNRQSLQTLKLCVTDLYSPQDCDLLCIFGDIGLPTLTNLDFTITSAPRDFRYSNLGYLISACPALEQVRIHGGGIYDTGVMEELSNLSSLRQLDIYLGFCSDVKITCSGNRNSVISLLEKSRTLRSFSFGYICHHNYVACICDSTKTRRYLLTNISRCVANSNNIQEFDISNTSIPVRGEFVSIIETLKDSQIRTLTIRVIRPFFTKREIEAIASLRNVSYLKIFDQGDSVDEYHLIQIFNKHKKGKPDIFVINVNKYHFHRMVAGRKLYPTTQEDYSKDGKIKNFKYYVALYAIKDILRKK